VVYVETYQDNLQVYIYNRLSSNKCLPSIRKNRIEDFIKFADNLLIIRVCFMHSSKLCSDNDAIRGANGADPGGKIRFWLKIEMVAKSCLRHL
jgi:hypothetical protein